MAVERWHPLGSTSAVCGTASYAFCRKPEARGHFGPDMASGQGHTDRKIEESDPAIGGASRGASRPGVGLPQPDPHDLT